MDLGSPVSSPEVPAYGLAYNYLVQTWWGIAGSLVQGASPGGSHAPGCLLSQHSLAHLRHQGQFWGDLASGD